MTSRLSPAALSWSLLASTLLPGLALENNEELPRRGLAGAVWLVV